jgi:hypothetical protein
MNHARLQGISIGDNHFTNDYPTFVVPMGSVVAKRVKVLPGKREYRVKFDKQIPLGVVQSANIQVIQFSSTEIPRVAIKEIKARQVVFHAYTEKEAIVEVEVVATGKYSKRYDYIIK